MSNDTGMTTGEVKRHLISAAARSEQGEIPRFSERYAMREAVKRITELQGENAQLRAQLATYTGITESLPFTPTTE